MTCPSAVGDDHATFPGIGSTLAAPESLISPAQKLMALSTRQNLEKLWADQKDRRSYQPQMGWNTATGEPWMAIRCYAGNAYPAISGPYNSHLKAVGKLIPEFVIMFQRLRKEKCILIVSTSLLISRFFPSRYWLIRDTVPISVARVCILREHEQSRRLGTIWQVSRFPRGMGFYSNGSHAYQRRLHQVPSGSL